MQGRLSYCYCLFGPSLFECLKSEHAARQLQQYSLEVGRIVVVAILRQTWLSGTVLKSEWVRERLPRDFWSGYLDGYQPMHGGVFTPRYALHCNWLPSLPTLLPFVCTTPAASLLYSPLKPPLFPFPLMSKMPSISQMPFLQLLNLF